MHEKAQIINLNFHKVIQDSFYILFILMKTNLIGTLLFIDTLVFTVLQILQKRDS